jgi:hypothetical protein
MTRSRAADDFGAIRARVEELRRERDQAPPEEGDRGPGPRSYHVARGQPPANGSRRLARAFRHKLFERKFSGVRVQLRPARNSR